MFTGLIEEIGTVAEVRRQGHAFSLRVAARTIMEDVRPGDSIAVDGVCLTAASLHRDGFTADVMPETVRVTTFEARRPGDPVNLERALSVGKHVGGHFVSGHIDGTGRIISRSRRENAEILRISAAPQLLRYLVMKGSIAVDGTSLTIMGLDGRSFSVSLIPHTRLLSVLGRKRASEPVNIECDLFAKYAARSARLPISPVPGKDLSLSFLESCGF